MTRVVSALTLDGHRLATEITITFRRPLTSETASSVADEAAKAAAYILGNQICQGALPLSKVELAEQLGLRTPGTVGKLAEVQVNSVRLLGGSPTRSTDRPRSTGPRSGRASSPTIPPPTDRPRRTASGLQPALAAPRLPTRTEEPPAKETPVAVPRHLWRPHLLDGDPMNPTALGDRLAPPLRDSAVTVLFLTLLAVDPARVERYPISGGTELHLALLREVAACLGAALYRVLADAVPDRAAAIRTVEQALEGSMPEGQAPTAEQMGLYFISQSPIADLAQRLGHLVGAAQDSARIMRSVAPYCRSLRTEFGELAQRVVELAGNASARGE